MQATTAMKATSMNRLIVNRKGSRPGKLRKATTPLASLGSRCGHINQIIGIGSAPFWHGPPVSAPNTDHASPIDRNLDHLRQTHPSFHVLDSQAQSARSSKFSQTDIKPA